MLHKALSGAGQVEMHHEYMVNIVQPLAVRRYQGTADAAEARQVLTATYVNAIRYSEMPRWGDSSNKLSWLIGDLAALLPQARFVHLVRDGRKVAGSYFHKLGDECYDDRSTRRCCRRISSKARPRRRRRRSIGGRCPGPTIPSTRRSRASTSSAASPGIGRR